MQVSIRSILLIRCAPSSDRAAADSQHSERWRWFLEAASNSARSDETESRHSSSSSQNPVLRGAEGKWSGVPAYMSVHIYICMLTPASSWALSTTCRRPRAARCQIHSADVFIQQAVWLNYLFRERISRSCRRFLMLSRACSATWIDMLSLKLVRKDSVFFKVLHIKDFSDFDYIFFFRVALAQFNFLKKQNKKDKLWPIKSQT